MHFGVDHLTAHYLPRLIILDLVMLISLKTYSPNLKLNAVAVEHAFCWRVLSPLHCRTRI